MEAVVVGKLIKNGIALTICGMFSAKNGLENRGDGD